MGVEFIAGAKSGNSVLRKMESVLQGQKAAHLAEGPPDADSRSDRINRLIHMIVDHSCQITEALSADFGCRSPQVTMVMETAGALNALKHATKHVRKWMRPERRRPVFPLGIFGAMARVEYQPKGVVGVISPWNAPIALTFVPLADILAAGNRCMIKPSEFTPATSGLIAEMIENHFDKREIAVFTGGPEVGQIFSGLPFDHLLFTGSVSVGRQVMKAASENLVPVTLELGGKSPVVFGRSAPMPLSVRRLMLGKLLNAGQICIGPDYLFVPEEKADDVVAAIQETVKKMFPSLLENSDYTSVINAGNYIRLREYLKDAQDKGATLIEINPASEDFTGQPWFKIPPTLILNPSDDTKVMQEEIFGPLLSIKTYGNFRETLDYINAKPRPLALYYFGKDEKEKHSLLNRTTSGAFTVNDVLMHYNQDDLPFGGIGNSGIGYYRGVHGFKTFSHAKACYRQTPVDVAALGGLYPPYGEKIHRYLKFVINK